MIMDIPAVTQFVALNLSDSFVQMRLMAQIAFDGEQDRLMHAVKSRAEIALWCHPWRR